MSELSFPLPKRLNWQREDGIYIAFFEDYCCTIEKYQIGARLRIRRPRFAMVVYNGKAKRTITKAIYDGGYASVAEAKARTLHCLKLLQGPETFTPTQTAKP